MRTVVLASLVVLAVATAGCVNDRADDWNGPFPGEGSGYDDLSERLRDSDAAVDEEAGNETAADMATGSRS